MPNHDTVPLHGDEPDGDDVEQDRGAGGEQREHFEDRIVLVGDELEDVIRDHYGSEEESEKTQPLSSGHLGILVLVSRKLHGGVWAGVKPSRLRNEKLDWSV